MSRVWTPIYSIYRYLTLHTLSSSFKCTLHLMNYPMKTLSAVCNDIKLPGSLAITHAVHHRQHYNGNGGIPVHCAACYRGDAAVSAPNMPHGWRRILLLPSAVKRKQPSSQTQPEFKHEGPRTKDLALPFINNTAKLRKWGHNRIQNFACHSHPPY